MTSISSITLQSQDPSAAERFYADAFELDAPVAFSAADAPSSGFRGFTLSLLVSQPADVHALIDPAVKAGARVLKPAGKSFWGYGGVIEAPDGAIWKVATSNKRDRGPASRKVESVVLLIGADDVAASKRFYVERGLKVDKSFGSRYVQFDTASAPFGFALYGRKALAKDAGTEVEGSGSHRIVIGSDGGSFTDPDGFAWTAG